MVEHARDGDGGSPAPLLRMIGVGKSYGRQAVLHDVDFDLRSGEVHVLAGENGAGKTTLINILGGAVQADRGRLLLNGREVRVRSPRQAAALGVAVIHQELSLAPDLSVADNIFMGRERCRGGVVLRRRQHRLAAAALARLGVEVDVRRPVGPHPIAIQQLVEIAKALVQDARIIVMDEPTSALREPEVDRLFALIADLKGRGCGIVFITHKLEEVNRIADRITVLRDGRRVVTAPAKTLGPDELVRRMVGRELPSPASEMGSGPGSAPCLSVRRMSIQSRRRGARPVVEDASFELRPGQIVGLAGLAGSGNSELLWALFGARAGRVSGEFRLGGEPYVPTSPRCAIRRGVALVTNDRQRTGLALQMDVAANLTLAALPRFSPGGWMDFASENRAAGRMAATLAIGARSMRQSVATLSGGNQQKVVLGKWLETRPKVFLLDEPTRGVDIGAKHEIYGLMRQWRADGCAILLITSELPELLRLCDRIVVLHRGRIAAEMERAEATPERVMHAAMGGR